MDKTLTNAMLTALEYYGRQETGDDVPVGVPLIGTRVALIRRGLLTAGRTHSVTNEGWATLAERTSFIPVTRLYTVFGLWVDETPLVAGVIEGDYNCVDTDSHSGGFQRWCTSVRAANPDAAECAAYGEMTEDDSED